MLRRLPVAGTSTLVGAVTLMALTLVVLTALEPTAARTTARAAPSPAESRAPVFLLHPLPVAAPTTLAPPVTETTAVPSTTVVTSVVAPRPTAVPATTRPPAPTPQPPPSSHPIVPPDNPTANIAPSPDFTTTCRQAGFGSAPCQAAATQATAAARAHEGLGAMALPSNFAGLTPGEQLFVLTDVERVDRGLPPVVGMVQELNQDAQNAAANNADPTPVSVPPGTTVMAWGSNWSEGAGPLGANYGWMYDDGPGSGNNGCSAGNPGSCWGHRDNELGFNGAQVASSHGTLIMGAAEATLSGDSPWSSDAELIALVKGSPVYTYTWAQAEASGAR